MNNKFSKMNDDLENDDQYHPQGHYTDNNVAFKIS